MAPTRPFPRRSARNHPGSWPRWESQNPARVEKSTSQNPPATTPRRRGIRLANPFYSGPKPGDRPRIRLANPFYSGPKPGDRRPRIRFAVPFYSGPKGDELDPHPDDDGPTRRMKAKWRKIMSRTEKSKTWLDGLAARRASPEVQIKTEPDSDDDEPESSLKLEFVVEIVVEMGVKATDLVADESDHETVDIKLEEE